MQTGILTACLEVSSGGLGSDGQFDQIKEAQCWGYVRENGVTKMVFRTYKDFQIANEYEIPAKHFEKVNLDNLNIFIQHLGYLGIHPAELYAYDADRDMADRVVFYPYDQDTTSILDPNLALGVYLKNNGNTVNIGIRNGSIQFGNYAKQRPQPDASARAISDSFEVATVASGTDTIISAYAIPEKANMVYRLDSGGTLTREFRITQTNRLKSLIATAVSNRDTYLNIYIVPRSQVSTVGAVFVPLNPEFNILERAVDGDVTLNSPLQTQQLVFRGRIDTGLSADVLESNFQIDANTVAVLTVTNRRDATDVAYTVFTEDLF